MEDFEKYHENIYQKLDYFHANNKIPNIIMYGSSGTGKRTILYQFLNKIYENDKPKMKMNMMVVNCAHGKGIKFIREELKFFAKSNIQTGVLFKSIILINADFLTNDAQSALRRCIELFSHNTRFFIIVEIMNRLLNPILSRFCAIYVPEYRVNGTPVNLHNYFLQQKYADTDSDRKSWLNAQMTDFMTKTGSPQKISEMASNLYENGYSCIDVIEWIDEHTDDETRSKITMEFHKIRKEYRCEKMLMFYMMMMMMI
jgi:Cdc6-like AAA superfamily ATPase